MIIDMTCSLDFAKISSIFRPGILVNLLSKKLSFMYQNSVHSISGLNVFCRAANGYSSLDR